MLVEVEFTIEPFVDAEPGAHVLAAVDAIRAAGLDHEMGPFGTIVRGEASEVIRAVARALDQAVAAGATRVSLQLTTPGD